MTCKYAWENGYQTAIRKVHSQVDEKLKQALEDCKKHQSHQKEYWRVVGRQDVLLEFFDIISDLINAKENNE
jgi:hypothetical protein